MSSRSATWASSPTHSCRAFSPASSATTVTRGGCACCPGNGVQIAPDRFRIPDVCVLRSTDPKDPIVRFAPLLCIEILSKDDSLSELQERVDDYSRLGTENIWALDPWKRRAWSASPGGFALCTDGVLGIPGTAIALTLPELFAELDED